MRIGLISDVHNDYGSLEKAIKKLENCDKIISLGDIIDDSKEANITLEIMRKFNIQSVYGQHDLTTLKVNQGLTEENKSYLNLMTNNIQIGEDILLVHDNPLSHKKGEGLYYQGEYIKKIDSAQKVFEECDKKIIIVGHTHLATQYVQFGKEVYEINTNKLDINPNAKYILNPGAVSSKNWQTPSVGILDLNNKYFSIININDN